jgi:hypothetical protein
MRIFYAKQYTNNTYFATSNHILNKRIKACCLFIIKKIPTHIYFKTRTITKKALSLQLIRHKEHE